MGNLEKFIENNRDEFDDLLPPEAVWGKVELAVRRKNRKRFFIGPVLKWMIAASVLLIVAAIAFMTIRSKNTSGKLLSSTDSMATDLTLLAPEQAPEMNQFVRLIAVKQEELKSIAKEQPELYQTFSKDIIQLDSSYRNLENKLSITPNRELLIQAMIQNLQLQLNVLTQQLNIIQQIKQSKKYSYGKNKSFT